MIESDAYFYSGLKWHYDCKKFAVQKIISFIPPADLFEVHLYHKIYIESMVSIICMSEEKYGDSFRNDLENALATKNKTGTNNYWYLRNLRNDCVHSGFDIAYQGHVIKGFICIASTERVFGKNKHKHGPYTPFFPYLRDMFAVYENVINPIIWKYFQEDPVFKTPKTKDELRKQMNDYIQESNFVPSWVKAKSADTIASLPDDCIKDHNMEAIKEILQGNPPDGLAVFGNE